MKRRYQVERLVTGMWGIRDNATPARGQYPTMVSHHVTRDAARSACRNLNVQAAELSTEKNASHPTT